MLKFKFCPLQSVGLCVWPRGGLQSKRSSESGELKYITNLLGKHLLIHFKTLKLYCLNYPISRIKIWSPCNQLLVLLWHVV